MAIGKILGFIGKFWFGRVGVVFEGRPILNGWPILTQRRRGQISFGANTVLTSWSKYNAVGVSHPVVVRALTNSARISVGDNTGLSGATICSATSIEIGSNCLIGADVMIVDTDFHPLQPLNRRFAPLESAASRPVRVGDNVFIGARSVILKGVNVGNDSVIGAGSVVTRDIPAGTIWAGNPCVMIANLKG